MYLINLIREIWDWVEVYRSVKKNKEFLLKYNLRIDWIGRLYTVINIPEEVAQHVYSREPYVLAQLRAYDEILIQVGLTELVFPEFNPIPNSTAYLLVLSPKREYLDIFKFIWNTFLYVILFFVIRFSYNWLSSNTTIINDVIHYIQTYI